jgi:tRNA-Thr(GGU) m(6)t(6)A37 methyltransferase TsaA
MGEETSSFCFSAIGVIQGPFQERFGTPRQPGLIASARGRIRLYPPYDNPACVEGLEAVSHLWVQFAFHGTAAAGWHPRVRPPRLGGNKRIGVFASRSNFRPNPIGLSVVRLDGLDLANNSASLLISGLDLLHGTPVLDIKPYLPYVDALADARNDIAPAAPEKTLRVGLGPEAEQQLVACAGHEPQALRQLIQDVIAYDPRPAYKRGEQGGEYAMTLMGLNVRWRIQGSNQAEVFEIRPVAGERAAPLDQAWVRID